MYLEKLNILIVEDNLGDFILIREHLLDSFLQATLTNKDTLADALSAIKEQTYDVILLDLTLPDCKGLESIEQMMGMAHKIPLIVLTGYNNKEFGIEGLKLGVQDYLIKDEINGSILEKSISYSIERKKNQLQMLESEKRFRALIEHSADGLALLTVYGDIIEMSSSATKIIGFKQDEIGNFTAPELIHPRDLTKIHQAFQQVLQQTDEIIMLQFRCKTAKGTYIWLEASLQNLLYQTEVNAIVLNFRDISQRKKEEEQRLQLIDELTKSYTDLKQFTYITSHNLRSPLTNLLSVIKLINWEGISDREHLQLLQAFKDSTIQLNDTLNDLFNILLIKQNKPTHLDTVLLEDVLRELLAEEAVKIKASSLKLSYDFSKAPHIAFNKPYLKSVFSQLIDNAIRFSKEETPLEIKVNSKLQPNHTVITFSDNGIGIDLQSNAKEKMFGLYQRFHQNRGGKGTGLYMVQSKITSLGGQISVASEVNKGTCFTLTFKH